MPRCRTRPNHIRHRLDRPIIDRQQHIAPRETDRCCGGAVCDVGRKHTLRTLSPQHSVFGLLDAGTGQDIGDTETQQHGDNDNGQPWPRPLGPAREGARRR